MSAKGLPVSGLENLTGYLESVGSPTTLQERAAYLLGLYQILGVEPTKFFVSEYKQEDGSPVHESLWLFTGELVMEARLSPAGDERLDFVPLVRAVRHLVVETHDYDLNTASEGSRMRIEVWFDDQRLGELRASGGNCDILRDILRSCLLPNIAPLATEG